MFGTRGLPKAGLPELEIAPELGVAPKVESLIVPVGGAGETEAPLASGDDGMLMSKIDQSKSDEDIPA